MSKYDLTNRTSDIDILQKNMRELQGQLADAHKRILELTSDRNSTLEELEQQKELLLELESRYNKDQVETTQLIEKQIEDWPDIVDSKPESFKMPPQPGYRFREGEKWVKIGADGEMEFEDIEIKD